MDDCCAVCAEPLEWVAYGSCGHREVCSTCVVRLRFVLGDKRCCICKVESSTVFVTKAMGDYTRVFNDFSMFPAGNNEGQVGSYWFHEDTQAYFDDLDHYKMIKAMCRLSCSICDARGAEAQGNEASKRKEKFRNIDQLKRHLFHRHKTFMCDLCLEGRKTCLNKIVRYDLIELVYLDVWSLKLSIPSPSSADMYGQHFTWFVGPCSFAKWGNGVGLGTESTKLDLGIAVQASLEHGQNMTTPSHLVGHSVGCRGIIDRLEKDEKDHLNDSDRLLLKYFTNVEQTV